MRYKLGAYFTDVKWLVKHGNWEDWVSQNISIGLRTAALYMEYFRRCQEAGYLVRYSKSASSAVLKAIADPPDYPEEEEKVTRTVSEEEAIAAFARDASIGGKKITQEEAGKLWTLLPEEEKAKYRTTTEPEYFPLETKPWYADKETKYWSPGKAAKTVIEKWGEVTRHRGNKEILEVSKYVMWYIKRYTDNTEYWLKKFAEENPVDIDSFEALMMKYKESHDELESLWRTRWYDPNPKDIQPPALPWYDDPNWPGLLYPIEGNGPINIEKLEEFKKTFHPQSASWSEQELIKRFKIWEKDNVEGGTFG